MSLIVIFKNFRCCRNLCILLSTFLVSTVFAQKSLVYKNPEALFQHATELLQKEKYGAAQRSFLEYSKLALNNLKSIEAEYFTSLCALYLFQPDASSQFESFVEKNPDHPRAQIAYFQLGNFYYDKKDYKQAEIYYDKTRLSALNRDQRTEAKFKHGYSQFAKKQFTEAKQNFDEVKKGKNAYTYAAAYYAGYIAFRNKDFSNAKEDLINAAQDDAYSELVALMLATCYFELKLYGEVINYATKMTTTDSKNKDIPKLKLILAETYYLQDKFNLAQPLFEDYKNSYHAPAPEVYFKLGYCYFKANDFEHAADNFKLISTKNDSLEQYTAFYLGLSYIKLDNFRFAISALQEAKKSKVNPEIAEEANFSLGKLYAASKLYNQAIVELQNFINLFPKSTKREEAKAILSEIFLESKDYDQAIGIIEKMDDKNLRVKTAYQKITYYRGLELYNQNRFPPAVKTLEKSLEFRLDAKMNFMAKFYIAESYSNGKRFESAYESYQELLKLREFSNHQFYFRSYYGIGYALFNTARYREAMPWFEKFLRQEDSKNQEMKPFYQDATIRLADCFYSEKKYSKAIVLYDKTIKENNPYADYAFFQKGIIFSINDQKDEAKLSFEKVQKNYPNSRYKDDAIFHSGQISYEKGFYEEAIFDFTNLVENRKNSLFIPFAMVNRGNCNSNLKNYKAAILDYIYVIDNFPTNLAASDAILNLQSAMNNENRKADFDAYLAKFEAANPKSATLETVAYKACKNQYDAEKYSEATSSFRQYLDKYETGNNRLDAIYYLGESYYRMNDYPTALDQYNKIIEGDVNWLTFKCYKRIANLKFFLKDYEGAATAYKKIENLADSRFDLINARLGLLKSYYYLNNTDSVNAYAESIIKYPLSTQDATNEAKIYQAKMASSKLNFDVAINKLKSIMGGTSGESGAEANYLVAENLFKQKKYAESIETLYKLNKNYPSYAHWVGKSFLLIADNFIAMDELFQAKATLQSIIDNAEDSLLRFDAKRRKIKVENLELAKYNTKDTSDILKDNEILIQEDSLLINKNNDKK